MDLTGLKTRKMRGTVCWSRVPALTKNDRRCKIVKNVTMFGGRIEYRCDMVCCVLLPVICMQLLFGQ